MDPLPRPIQSLSPFPSIRHLAIGVFDGVHRGHQAVLHWTHQQASDSSVCAALTFDPHPLQVIAPAQAPPLLTTLAQRCRLIQDCGLGEIVILQFDAALRQLEAKQFIAALHRLFPRLQTLSMGDNWTFGKDREGNTAQLRRWAEGHGFSCSSITPLEENGRPISSTRIRQAILDRDFSTAALLLGRPYAVAGRVSRGEQRGRTLGFPTANLADVVQLLPPLGVYAGCATIPNGKKFRAVLNLGSRPTFHSNPATSLEIHLLEFQGDLYDQKIEICPLQYLRDEQKFADSAALQQQIRKDISQALQCNFPPC